MDCGPLSNCNGTNKGFNKGKCSWCTTVSTIKPDLFWFGWYLINMYKLCANCE